MVEEGYYEGGGESPLFPAAFLYRYLKLKVDLGASCSNFHREASRQVVLGRPLVAGTCQDSGIFTVEEGS